MHGTLENSVPGSSSMHGWFSPKLSALPGDRCSAVATEDDVTSVVPVVEFVAAESVDSCAAAALVGDAPVAVASAPVPIASGAEFVSPIPVEFKVQLCLNELVPAATAACPAAVLPEPWAGYTPGLACLDGCHSDSDEELWEYVEVELWPMHDGTLGKGEMQMLHDEFVKEMEEEKMHYEFETVLQEKGEDAHASWEMGLPEMAEVVFNVRVRGGGFGGAWNRYNKWRSDSWRVDLHVLLGSSLLAQQAFCYRCNTPSVTLLQVLGRGVWVLVVRGDE